MSVALVLVEDKLGARIEHRPSGLAVAWGARPALLDYLAGMACSCAGSAAAGEARTPCAECGGWR